MLSATPIGFPFNSHGVVPWLPDFSKLCLSDVEVLPSSMDTGAITTIAVGFDIGVGVHDGIVPNTTNPKATKTPD
jgi:hypothetical protein